MTKQKLLLQEQIDKKREQIRKEHGKLAVSFMNEEMTEQEYRQKLLELDYGEIHNLWRTKYLRCANPKDITLRQLVEAAQRAHGIVTVMARILGIERHVCESLIMTHPHVKRVMAEERENLVDMAECRVFEKANEGCEWAVKMILECLGKNRGWTKNVSPAENKGRILAAIENMTSTMDEEEMLEYDEDNNSD